MIIRTATLDDLPAIIDMGERLQRESRGFEPLLTFNWQQAYGHYSEEMSNENAKIIVAVDADGALLGYQYSYVVTLDYLPEKNRECTLEALYVKPECRGKGVGSELVRRAEQWGVEEMKVDRIKAGIYADNVASEAVHLRAGFRPYYTEYIKLCGTSGQ